MESVLGRERAHRAPVADVVYIKLFVGGLFFGLKKNAVVRSMEKTKQKGH